MVVVNFGDGLMVMKVWWCFIYISVDGFWGFLQGIGGDEMVVCVPHVIMVVRRRIMAARYSYAPRLSHFLLCQRVWSACGLPWSSCWSYSMEKGV